MKADHKPFEIAVTANRQEEEPGRLARLHQVVGYVCALDPRVLPKVASLHDHKGMLDVGWRRKPTDRQKGLFHRAWGSEIGDGCDSNVEHLLVGKGVPSPANAKAKAEPAPEARLHAAAPVLLAIAKERAAELAAAVAMVPCLGPRRVRKCISCEMRVELDRIHAVVAGIEGGPRR